jgi:uncharacterized protein (DUF1684 family)
VSGYLELVDWRRQVQALYAAVRAEPDPATGHARWRAGRDHLFREHPQSPLVPDDPLRDTGLPYWPYDPALRIVAPLRTVHNGQSLVVPTGDDRDGDVHLTHIGTVEALDSTLDVWWLHQYAGGLFLPVRDGTAGTTSYGAGRYLLDTAKGADLGTTPDTLTLDLNFLYHPSCRYNPAYVCPLAPEGNRLTTRLEAGERL